MAFYVAVDSGGTKTNCWIADDEKVLASGRCGTVKHMAVPVETATERLQMLLYTTAKEAGVDLKEVSCTCMGIGGFSIESMRLWTERTLAAEVGGKVIVCGDEEIALEAAFHGGPGNLAIAGTGSIVMGRCSSGKQVIVGGWGPVVGDEGAGGRIGLEAVREAMRAKDRGEASTLLDEVQTFWGCESLGELIGKVNDRIRPNFAELTVVVSQCAEKGDAVARRVLECGGRELAELILLAAAKMQDAGCAAEDATQVAFAGSVVDKIALVRETMTARLQAAGRGMVIAEKAVEPLEGALWMARRG